MSFRLIRFFLILCVWAVSTVFLIHQHHKLRPKTICPRQGDCTITFSPGGEIKRFIFVAHDILKYERNLTIDGECYSACTILADFARPHVCITPNAVMFFHRSNFGDRPPQSSDIMLWVFAHGDYPSFDSQKFTRMDYEDAKQFWPTCKPVRTKEAKVH